MIICYFTGSRKPEKI